MREPLKALKDLFLKIDTVELTDFELNYLAPMILDCLKFYLDQFKKIIPYCDDPDSASRIDAAVREIFRLSPEQQALPSPENGYRYLQDVKRQVTEDWIPDISAVLDEFIPPGSIKNGQQFYKLIQDAQRIAGSVIGSPGSLFRYQMRGFPVITDQKTNQTIYAPPFPAIEVISYPFELILGEVARSAKSLQENLIEWSRQRREMRKDYITYLTAVERTRSARLLNYFQILVIIFTIVLTLSSSKIVHLARQLLALIQS